MADEIIENDLERRQAFRLDMEKELVDIFWQDEQGNEQQRKIACIDFSRGGLRIDCDRVIEPQSEVVVIFRAANPNSQRLYGKVIRCLMQDNGWYDIALQIDDDR